MQYFMALVVCVSHELQLLLRWKRVKNALLENKCVREMSLVSSCAFIVKRGRKSVSYPDFSLLLRKLSHRIYLFFFKRRPTVDPSTERCWPSPKPRHMKNVCWQVSNGAKKIGVTVAQCGSGWMGSARERKREILFCVIEAGAEAFRFSSCIHKTASVSLYYTASADGLVSTAPDDFGPTDQSLSVCRIDATMSLC